jgi:hypothetical protein
MDEVDVEAVDLRHELRQRIQPLREPRHVVGAVPVTKERLGGRQLYALRVVLDGLLPGQSCRPDPTVQVVNCPIWEVNTEWAHLAVVAGTCIRRG